MSESCDGSMLVLVLVEINCDNVNMVENSPSSQVESTSTKLFLTALLRCHKVVPKLCLDPHVGDKKHLQTLIRYVTPD